MPNLRSQSRNSTTNDSSSTDDVPTNGAAEHTRNNASGCKRKNKNNDSVPITNDVQSQRQQHDRSPHKRQHTEDDCESKESTKTSDDHTPFEESPATIILGLDYYILCKLAKEKLSWVVGNGQRHILPVQLELTRYYSGEGNGVDTLKADIAAINHNYGFSSDDDSDDEVEEINKKSSVAAAEDAAEEDDGDFSFDNDGGDESIDGTTDGLGETSTSTPAVVSTHDNATQSSTTTATLKLDSSCVEKGLDENREDDDPSPTTVNVDLSRFTDISPAPDTDSNNGSNDKDGGDQDVLNFDIRPKCIGGAVSPKKVNATKSVRNAPTINPPPQHFGYAPLPPSYPQNGYPPHQYSYQSIPNQHDCLQPPQHYNPLLQPPTQYGYPTRPNHGYYSTAHQYSNQSAQQYYGYSAPNPAQHIPTITFRARKQTVKSNVGIGFDNKNKIFLIAPFSIFIGSGLVVGSILRSINGIKLLSSDHALSIFANAKGVVSIEVSPPLPVVNCFYSTAQNQSTQWGRQYYSSQDKLETTRALQHRLAAGRERLKQLESARARLHQIEQPYEFESLEARSALQLQQQLLAQETEAKKNPPTPNITIPVHCMKKMTSPIPSRCPHDNTTASVVELPDFSHLVNFPLAKKHNKCVMCNTSEFNIPKQNKSVCNNCDVAIWVASPSGMYIKWCKGCKIFKKWVDFGDKGGSTKCESCRDKQMMPPDCDNPMFKNYQKQWREQHTRGSEQAQQLVPKESESASSSSTVSFSLGSTHSITSNLDTHKIINLDYAKSIFQDYMIRELEGRLESGTTVSVTNIVRRTEKKRVWAEVVYQVVKIKDSKLPAPVVSSSASSNNSTNKIKVSGYTFSSSVNARYHVSLGDLLKMYGKASLQHLYNLNEVASLDTAKRVDDMSNDDPIRQHGGVYSFEFEESPSSLPLSPMIEEEEFSEDDPTEEEFSNDEPDEKKKEEKDKHGMTGSFGGRRDKYLFKGKDGKMYIRIDGEDLSIEADAGLCKLYDLLMQDVKNDFRVPPWIKRALCIMLHELGGDRFGGKKNIVYLLLEMALQLEDGHSVPGEMFQWDDTVFIGMVTKLMEALEAIKPILDRLPKVHVKDIIMKLLSSWPPGTDEERLDQVYNTLVAEAYIGLSEGREDAFDGPAKPDWKTQAEKYSKEYTVKQFDAAIHKIKAFINEAKTLRRKGCLFLLDKNDLACGKGESLEAILKSFDFEVEATLYESPNDIIIYTNGKAIIVVHGPLSVGGTIMVEHFSLDDMLQRCLVIDTLRGIVCMAKGEEFNGPYLAIEAGMMQKLLVKGLHLSRKYGVPAAFFREYLNTSRHVKCFDSYGNGRWVHYPEYSISNVNRARYKRYNK